MRPFSTDVRPIARRLSALVAAILAAPGCLPVPRITSTATEMPTGQLAVTAPVSAATMAAGTPSPDSQRTPDEEAVTRVYHDAGPGVVKITTVAYTYDEFLEAVLRQATGSGFIYDVEGHIVTNDHVVADAESVEVTLADRTRVTARIVGRDPTNDLAVVKVDLPRDRLHRLTLVDSAALRIGQLTIAIGDSFGLDRTVTTGVVSSLNRNLRVEHGQMIVDVIQVDVIRIGATITPGNSVGPLLDSRGEVVGVNSAVFAPSGGSGGKVGVGFAVLASPVRRAVAGRRAGSRRAALGGRRPRPLRCLGADGRGQCERSESRSVNGGNESVTDRRRGAPACAIIRIVYA